jgi:hypothetical protein
MHRPGDELHVAENKPMPEIGGFGDPEKGWYWMGRTLPDLPAMQGAHDALAALLKSEGVEIVYVGEAAPGRMKQIYTRDSVIGVKGRRCRRAACEARAPRGGAAGHPCAGEGGMSNTRNSARRSHIRRRRIRNPG